MICFPLDNTRYEAKEMGAYLCTRTRGVFSADDNLAVSPGTEGLSVLVSPGIAWFKWSEYWGTAAVQEKSLTLKLDAADGALDRLDVVVGRLDKVGNLADISIRKGSFSSAPAITDPVRDESADEIYLSSVRVRAGAVSITAEDITDMRLNEEYCGLMRDGVTGIPTAQLQEQAQELINHLNEEIKGIEQGSEVMLKATYGGSADGVVKDSDNLGGKAPQWWMPTGSVIPYAGKSAPDGWLLCDGAAVSRTTYADLFAVIGTTFGSGDGSTTFNLPDLRGRVAVGVDSDANLGRQSGATSQYFSWDNLPTTPALATWQDSYKAVVAEADAPNLYGVNNKWVGAGTPLSNVQPSLNLNQIIKI